MNTEVQTRIVLIIEDKASDDSKTMNKALDRLEGALDDKDIMHVRAESYIEAYPLVETNMDIDAFLVASNMDLDKASESEALKLIKHIRERQGMAPVFLMADRADTSRHISGDLMALANEFVWIFEDSPVFIAGRIEGAISRYRETLLPPLMKAIWEYNEQKHEYSHDHPGHQGGIGFTKSPAGKKFYDFYGENLFRTDTGIERSSIGSLLDHEGAFKKSEEYAAKVFGSNASYSVVVGTSGSNRTVMQACLTEKDIALCDRNCHKSIEQGLILSGATPVYMIPTRNRYGIIGPIHRSEMTPEAVKAKIDALPSKPDTDKASYAVVTNCTYDGLCYNAAKVEAELDKSVDRIHFDEAWYAYARFNPMYTDHYAMRGDPAKHKGATVFATHSTHKLLNALSQASWIHVRDGRRPIDFDRINQSYMLHATTSPLYAICASNDISTAMMHNCGESLTREVIAEAVDFRQAMAKLEHEAEKNSSWFFKPWNAEKVKCPQSGKEYDFASAPRDLLVSRQEPWRLEEGQTWHGFSGLEENWVMLDPIKVSILAPGMGDDGNMLDHGVPAAFVGYYLYQNGIIPTRITDFQIMFLFSQGITKGKWGTLVNALLNFKKFYEQNKPINELFPDLAAKYPKIYAKAGVRDLSERMFDYLKKNNPGEVLNKAFGALPKMEITPRTAFEKIVTGDVEFVASDSLANRVTANSIIPYPPGIPMLMSGENFGDESSPQIQYLKSLETWDREFPGFEHVTEGAKSVNGKYCVMCVK